MSRDSFVSPRVPALSERKNTSRLACVCLTELFLLKLQMLSFISMLPFAGFSPAAPPPFHFSCDGCSHCEPPQAGRQVVYHSCD